MGLKVTNNAFGTLNAGITSSATTIVLTAGQGARFPTLSAGDYFYATLIDTSNNLEIVKVTARSTDTMTVVRAQDNTTARAYSTNDRFELRPTAALFNEKANTADVAATYVELAGDTMTGTLVIETTGNPRVRIKATDNSTSGLFLQTFNSGVQTGTATVRVDSSGNLQVYNGTTSEALNLQVDSGGRATIPNQPAFRADFAGFSTTTTYATPSSWTVRFNKGNHFNSSNGRFVAPVAGVYSFSGAFLRNSSSIVHRGRFHVNGGNSWDGELRTTEGFSGYNEATALTQVFQLNANDYVEWKIMSDSSGSIYGTGYNYFCGHLIS